MKNALGRRVMVVEEGEVKYFKRPTGISIVA